MGYKLAVDKENGIWYNDLKCRGIGNENISGSGK
jgi:hypothetical protein